MRSTLRRLSRDSRYSIPPAAAAQNAENRLMRNAIEPTGTSSVHSLPKSTYSG